MVTCDSSFAELIDEVHRSLRQEKMVTIRMIGDKRPYNFPLPIKRMKPTVKGEDSVQEYRPYMVAEYIEWARTPHGQAKIAAVAAMHARGGSETISSDDAEQVGSEDDLI